MAKPNQDRRGPAPNTKTNEQKTAESAHLASQGKLEPNVAAGKMRYVVAVERGYYIHLREEGDVFQVPASMKTEADSWFKDSDQYGNIEDAPEEDGEELV